VEDASITTKSYRVVDDMLRVLPTSCVSILSVTTADPSTVV
jgi:hypothetical protein